MKFKLDENLPTDFAEWLRSQGSDARTVFEEGLAGSTDKPLLETATAEQRILLTFDRDFSDGHAYPPASHAGIIVFRLRDHRWSYLRQRVEATFPALEMTQLAGALTIIDDIHIRYRGPKR